MDSNTRIELDNKGYLPDASGKQLEAATKAIHGKYSNVISLTAAENIAYVTLIAARGVVVNEE